MSGGRSTYLSLVAAWISLWLGAKPVQGVTEEEEALSISERLTKLETTIAQMDKRLNDFHTELVALRGEFSTFRDRVDDKFTALRGEIKDTFTALRGEIKDTEKSLRGEISALRAKMDTQFYWVLGVIGGLLGVMLVMWINLNSTIRSNRERIAQVETTLGRIDATLQGISSRLK